MDTIDVTHTSWVSGCSKFIFLAVPKRAFTMASLMKYDRPLAITIMMRMTKIQTRSWTCTVGVVHGQQDEGDERDAGDAVGFETVGRGTNRVARVVAGAVRDDARVARVVFLDLEDDLHQVRADVGDLGEDAARDTQGRRAQRLADGEADEARAGPVTRHEEQDAQHDHQLDADEQHADAHARAQRNGIDGIGLALEAGERRARVGEGVHADAEPGHAVAARDAHQAEEHDDRHARRPAYALQRRRSTPR